MILDAVRARLLTPVGLRTLAPEHPEVASLGERVRTRRQKIEPQLIVRAALEEAARLIRDGRSERVPEVLARVRAVNPQHPELAKLEAQAKRVAAARDVRVRLLPGEHRRDLLMPVPAGGPAGELG